MKKIFLIITLLLISVPLLTGCKKNNEEDDKDYLIALSLDQLEEKVANKESFILVITQTDCTHCKTYKPNLIEVLKEYNIVAYELDEQNFNAEEKGRLSKIANVSGTPTTLFITEGEEKSTTDRLIGAVAKKKIIASLKTFGYIKE